MGSGSRFRLSLVGSIMAAVVVEFDPHLAWLVISICEGRGDGAHRHWCCQVGNGGGGGTRQVVGKLVVASMVAVLGRLAIIGHGCNKVAASEGGRGRKEA